MLLAGMFLQIRKYVVGGHLYALTHIFFFMDIYIILRGCHFLLFVCYGFPMTSSCGQQR